MAADGTDPPLTASLRDRGARGNWASMQPAEPHNIWSMIAKRAIGKHLDVSEDFKRTLNVKKWE